MNKEYVLILRVLQDHLEMLLSIAEKFGDFFFSSSWGKLAGFAHDLGKSTPEWQKYIREKSGFEKEGESEREKNA
jgi:CRISPR-associated endonuclease Cas3-HD